MGQAQRVWLIYFPREMEQVQAIGAGNPALDWLGDRYAGVRQEQFGDLVVALYQWEEP